MPDIDDHPLTPAGLPAFAAGNGLLDRRMFLCGGLVFSAVTLSREVRAAPGEKGASTRPPWMREPGAPFTPYGQPSPYEDEVVRYPSPNREMRNNGASWTPLHLLEGTLTPNGLHFERHHNGVPAIDPARHELLIHGKVNQARRFAVKDLLRYPMRSRVCFLECAGNSNAGFNLTPSTAQAGYFHGLVSCSEWTGIPVGTLLQECGLNRDASWIIAEGADAFAMDVSMPLNKVLDDGLVAFYQNGERLRPENGYPLRLVLPGWEGVRNVKWLRRLELTDRPADTRNETARYTELLPSGKARMFDFVMEAKSLITSPSGGMVLSRKPGLYQVTGLAWSGRGKIARVDVSADGGATWAPAELQEPILPMAFTRFRIPWQWNGGKARLKSRAVDETGYVQPEREALIAQRGRQGYYHYNAIVTWEVDEAGNVGHVYDKTRADLGDHPPVDADWN